MSVLIINSRANDDDDETELNEDEEEIDVDEDNEDEEENEDEEDEKEIDEVDENEEELEIEEDEEEINVEDVDDDVDLEESDEVQNDLETTEESADIDLHDIVSYEPTHKRKRITIQKYCKSSKELEPRVNHMIDISNYRENVLEMVTSSHNAKKFCATLCDVNSSNVKNELYQLCGKFIKKEYLYSELFDEMKNGISHWDSKTFGSQKEKEKHDIMIMTVKLSVSEGLYECGRCKSKKTFSRQVQTRSADEGMTSIIQCSECNKVWREYA